MLPTHTLQSKSPSAITRHLLNILMHYLHKQDDEASDATAALQIITKITPLIRLYQTALDRGDGEDDPALQTDLSAASAETLLQKRQDLIMDILDRLLRLAQQQMPL